MLAKDVIAGVVLTTLLVPQGPMIGYMNGLALTILVGQLPKLFGFKVEAEGLIGEVTGFVKGLANGEAAMRSAERACARARVHPRRPA